MQEYEDLKTLVTELEADVGKFEGGNKAAGTRIRKQMQMVKKAAQNVRNQILSKRT
jgi:tripartite-type tricarboxylate transporter receptor subunit TctC